uniref:G_PROTEIN_RECEP_F1_2 domain-containing protein n=1 Tax=Rhabditophanes sp. KR3021 TaxID=114890 RepID=A0AC35U8I1_9BILA
MFLDFFTILNLSTFFISVFTNLMVLSLYKHFESKKNIAMLSIFCQFALDLIFSVANLILRVEIIVITYEEINYLTYRLNYFDYMPTTFFIFITIFVRYAFVTRFKIELRHLILMYIISIITVAAFTIPLCFLGFDKSIDPQIIYHSSLISGIIDSSITSESKIPGMVAMLIPIIAIITTLAKYRKFIVDNELKLTVTPAFAQFLPTCKLHNLYIL